MFCKCTKVFVDLISRAFGFDRNVAHINCVIPCEHNWSGPSSLAKIIRVVAYPITAVASKCKKGIASFALYVEKEGHHLHLSDRFEDKLQLGSLKNSVKEVSPNDDLEWGIYKDTNRQVTASLKAPKDVSMMMYRQSLMKELGSVVLADKVLHTANNLNSLM